MALFTNLEADRNGLKLVTVPDCTPDRTRRIMAALGVTDGRLPRVDDESLARYFEYLSAELSLPFTVHYPAPTTRREALEFRCVVVELLDPAKHLGDPLDGIFCKTRKGGFEVNLPLIELHVSPERPQFQLIEDYWYWFWNWR